MTSSLPSFTTLVVVSWSTVTALNEAALSTSLSATGWTGDPSCSVRWQRVRTEVDEKRRLAQLTIVDAPELRVLVVPEALALEFRRDDQLLPVETHLIGLLELERHP